MIELLLGLMIADNRISISELHIVRFMADLFFVEPTMLNSIYNSLTGNILPELGDPSSIEWWKKKEKKYETDSSTYRYLDEKRKWALSVFGLTENPTSEEIKEKYHELCHIHHSDKFNKLGPEATHAANIIFTKIKKAYEILVEE